LQLPSPRKPFQEELVATPDEHEDVRGVRHGSRAASRDAEDFTVRLSPEAEAIRSARPDAPAAICEILAEGWRDYEFSSAEISAWLLAGFDADRGWFAAALRQEGVAPSMLTKFYRHRGSRDQEQLINVVLGFAHDQRNPAALRMLLDRWAVERSGRHQELRAG
jgi:hypothetical protein